MAKFKCKVYWEMSGEVEVEAVNRVEAADKALEEPLPTQSEYVPDSVNCDYESDVQEI